MSNSLEDEDTLISSQTKTRVSYKSILDHAHCLLSYWKYASVAAIGIFGALLGIAEGSASILNINFRGWFFYTAAVLFTLIVTTGRILYIYLKAFPEGLENESLSAKRIAQIQCPLWKFNLARQLLEDKLRELDNELSDLFKGHIFIAIEQKLGIQEYIKWAGIRPASLLRMLEVAKQLLVINFPKSLNSHENNISEPVLILSVVNQIRDLYAETVSFERERHTVEPPEPFLSLHNLQSEWTNPIRNGIQQMFRFLDQVLSLDTNSDHKVEFTIEFEEPPNIAEFNNEMGRLHSQLPRLMRDEIL